MATTTITAETKLAKVIKDPDKKIFDTDDLQAWILDHVNLEQTYQAQLITEGYWRVTSPVVLALWNPTFTAPTGTHTIYAAGGGGINPSVSIRLTADTDARTEISIIGAPIDWGNLVAEVMTYIANFRALEYSQSQEGSSVSPETSRRELLRQADIYRGVVAI